MPKYSKNLRFTAREVKIGDPCHISLETRQKLKINDELFHKAGRLSEWKALERLGIEDEGSKHREFMRALLAGKKETALSKVEAGKREVLNEALNMIKAGVKPGFALQIAVAKAERK